MVFQWYLEGPGSFWCEAPMCVDTYAPFYRNLAVQAAGAVAVRAESLKEAKYADLLHTHEFVPIASCGVLQCFWATIIGILE